MPFVLAPHWWQKDAFEESFVPHWLQKITPAPDAGTEGPGAAGCRVLRIPTRFASILAALRDCARAATGLRLNNMKPMAITITAATMPIQM